MPTIYPPLPLNIPKNKKSIFLAGSIDMENAIDWQQEIITYFKENETLCFLNPRRKTGIVRGSKPSKNQILISK